MFRKPSTFLGHGWSLENQGKIKKISLPDSARKGHLFCFGTTRIGKTKLIEQMIEQDIRKGYSVVFFDPKGDPDIFSKIVQVVNEEKCQEALSLVTPIFPECSAQIDPLSHYYMPEEIVSHVISGIKAKEEFFINIAYETTLIVILALIEFAKVKNEKPVFNFNIIKERISYKDLVNMKTQLESLPKSPGVEDVLVSLRQIVDSPQDYFAKVSASLRTVLTSLSTGSAGSIIGKSTANQFIQRLEAGKQVIMVVQTGSLLTRKTAHMIARVLLSMIQSFVGRKYASGKKVDPPMCLYLDEAGSLLYMGIEDLFNKSGGADVWIHAFTQSIADPEAEIGKPQARKILDNTNTKIFMRVNDPGTAEYIAAYSGMQKKYSPILSLGGGITIREIEEPAVRPEDVMNLQQREFFMFSAEGAFRGKTAFTKEPYLKIVYPQTKST
ncbi:hypothetical protein BuS5_04032 (plasmid) [Desulfosarcina sp. BuS5]|uniref:type IV secretory system conjugative DNA transfer family protein n=1 Tax=Desulfosarcina sp. BuS5 TaxID=933262 RepID=UPI00237817C9|nr:TraM recognition domain-containing protein [Desulfosarcina sp. BuS5]WDN91060.1 hypothetical protein BuS5_04032 [Desulfosarcina sp. BuS5]